VRARVRKIVDSNYLRRAELEDYLSKSPHNEAVLTEFVLLEAQKREPLLTLAASTAILSRFPNQVLVLRPSSSMRGFHGRGSGLQKRLIDRRKSAEFGSFCKAVNLAASGDGIMPDAILREARIAKSHIDSLAAAAPTILDLFRANLARFAPDEIGILRSRLPRPWPVQEKLLDLVFESAGEVARGANLHTRRQSAADIVNLPVVRYCLCMALLFIRWIENGRQPDVRNDKIANDVIDANIAAYSTYFDGVLSGDGGVQSLAAEARYILTEIGGYAP
jgi:hypothetical protein